MHRSFLKPASVVAFAVCAAPLLVSQAWKPAHADVGLLSGTVRDAEGIPQMGALVEALLPDARVAASTLTDSSGRYRFTLDPGSYRIRASAALLLPALRERLQIAGGARSVVNLTLTTILAPGGWLPVSRRTLSEPGDDWMWTLRSSPSRSILRFSGLTEDAAEGALAVSSSRQETRRGATAGRVTLKDSEGGFARGGSHNILVLTRVNEDGSGAVLRADLSGTRSPYPVAPSAEISVGLQRRTLLNGYSRAVLTYSSHPELVNSHATGMQGATLRSAQRVDLGDLIRVDVGSVVRESNLGGNALALEPFLRISSRPGDDVVLAYTMTRSRGTESIEDLDRVQAGVPVAVFQAGHLRLEGGSHHALSATGKVPGGGIAELSVYRDNLRNPFIAGTGTLGPAELQADGLTADPTTRTYRVAARDYDSTGVRLSFSQPVTRSLRAGGELSTGNALQVSRVPAASLATLLGGLHPATAYAATAFVDGGILSTGTVLRASYRWQPHGTLTAVDTFHVADAGAYLSCSLRQSLAALRFLPRGLEAVLDVQNLLSQGYEPFLSSDGQTLYLAQTPRTLQAGISFSF